MIRRLLAAVALTVALASSASAVSYTKFEAITIAAASLGFTAANINNVNGHPAATSAICRLSLAEIRFTIDGSTPSSSAGVLWEPLEERTFTGNDTLNVFRAFRTGSTSGQLDCHYLGSY